ncbi:ribosomal protein S18-alanine N-acetyltransferase [Kiloniella sp.]|uniref:ribosomal protein S18-alanine N-acetyltransferase n=1 Tax=Kiloniella sp. TaxID=1938587 RepID=UPI003B017282
MSEADYKAKSILEAGLEHTEVLAELHARSFPDAMWDANSISQILSQVPNNGFIYCIKGTPIGFALWQNVAGEAEILTICIDPEWRGNGFSRLLVAEIVTYLSQNQVSKLFLEVAEDNIAAISLYSNVGFKEIGRRKKYYHKPCGNLVDALVMQLDIT